MARENVGTRVFGLCMFCMTLGALFLGMAAAAGCGGEDPASPAPGPGIARDDREPPPRPWEEPGEGNKGYPLTPHWNTCPGPVCDPPYDRDRLVNPAPPSDPDPMINPAPSALPPEVR